MKTSACVLVVVAATLLTACGTTTKKAYTNPNYSVTQVQRIAILPFDGVPDANTAGDIIAMVLQSRKVFDAIVDRSQIKSIVAEHRLPADLINDETIIAKKGLINADALLKGRVTQFSQGAPSVPLATPTKISISLRLVSATTGEMIWTQLYSQSSAGRGLASPAVDDMMIEMAEEIANDLANLRAKK